MDALAATRGVANVGEERKWDADEYKRRALERADRESGAAEAAARVRLARGGDAGGTAPKFLEARSETLNFLKDAGSKMAVNLEATGGRTGYHCKVCELTFNDSQVYTRHLNSAEHLSKLGLSTLVRRSSRLEVQQRLRQRVLAKHGLSGRANQVDERSFEQRVADAEAAEARRAEERAARKAARKAERKAERAPDAEPAVDQEVMDAMGFGGFGAKKKKNR